jgi:hypothetical protein
MFKNIWLKLAFFNQIFANWPIQLKILFKHTAWFNATPDKECKILPLAFYSVGVQG